MGLLSKVASAVLGRSADAVTYSDKWSRRHAGVLFEFARETDSGIQLRRSNADVYENMETGEVVVVQRKDTRTEWHNRENRREWPERVERAYRDGYVWWNDLRDPENHIPPFRGCLISKGGGSLWRFLDDVEPPREEWSP